MQGLGRVHEKCRCAGGGQGGCYLAGHMAGFANARHHNTALTMYEQLGGSDKTLVQSCAKRLQCLNFDSEGATCRGQDVLRIEKCRCIHGEIVNVKCALGMQICRRQIVRLEVFGPVAG